MDPSAREGSIIVFCIYKVVVMANHNEHFAIAL